MIIRFFTTGVKLAKGDCLYALIVQLIHSVYFSNRSANSFNVNVLITGLPFKGKVGHLAGKKLVDQQIHFFE